MKEEWATPRLTDDDFRRMERGNINLQPQHKEKIQQLLSDYCEFRRAERDGIGRRTEKRLEDVLKGLELCLKNAGLLEGEPHSLWAQIEDQARAAYPNGLRMLRALRDSAQKTMKRPRARGNFVLDDLLRSLARVFREAGGKSTKVSNRETGRRGAFIEFAHTALATLPHRRTSIDALASRWERAERRKPTGTWLGTPHPRASANKRILERRQDKRG